MSLILLAYLIANCDRQNSSSLDSNLKDIKLNDIPKLLKEYPNIVAIFFSSKKSSQLYERVYKDLDIKKVTLPSPSPANARVKIEEKIEIYKKELGKFI
jgi:TDG/mug DNA glycosylase family protein